MGRKLIIQLLLNFIHKCHIHYTSIIYIILAFIVKQLSYYLLAMLIVLIHEFCHYSIAYYLNFTIDKVEILPFGAFLSLDDNFNHSIIDEACVILAGPCSHFFIFVFIQILPLCIYKNYLFMINRYIFLFNLLPIYPLDGGRFIGLILEMFIDIKKALHFHFKLSVLSLCILSVFYFQFQTIIVIIYLYFQQIIYYRLIPLYIRLCYLYSNDNHQKIIVHDKLYFRRGYQNYYYVNQKILTHKQMLYILLENV